MTIFETLVDRLGLPATGIHATAEPPHKCLWSCTWILSPVNQRGDGAYTSDQIMPVENLTQAQAIAECQDIAAWTVYQDRVESGQIASEAASWAVKLAASESWLADVRDFIRRVRPYDASGRFYVLPGESLPSWRGGESRPGWEE